MTLLVVALIGSAVVGLWWVPARLVLVRVEGSSMAPTLVHGDRVMIRRTSPGRLRAGQVIVIRKGLPYGRPVRPDDPMLMIKRVAAVPGDPVPKATFPALRDVADHRVPAGRLVLTADNPAGTDSRHLGYFYEQNLLGVTVRST